MTYLKINDTLYPAAIRGWYRDKDWDNRDSMAVTLEMTYEEAVATFVSDMEWGHVHQDPAYVNEAGETVTPDPVVYDDSDYSVAGPITDHRDGTVTVKMGKITDGEALAELREALNV